MKGFQIGVSLVASLLLFHGLALEANSQPELATFDVGARFYASGWIGDGKYGEKYIQLIKGSRENPHSSPISTKIIYTPGPEGFAGIFWQNRPNNWGQRPGTNFSAHGFTALKFWSRGEEGGELVEFKIGGIDSTHEGEAFKYKDSLEESLGEFTLEIEWTEYTIPLEGVDLSSVLGGFYFGVSKSGNPDGLTFFLDDIRLVKEEQ